MMAAIVPTTGRYVLDTNMATYILDGELRRRQPVSLIKARSEMAIAYKLAGDTLEDIIKHCKPLGRSRVAYSWCRSLKPMLFITPTVHTELMQAQRVDEID